MASNTKSNEAGASGSAPDKKKEIFFTERINRLGTEMDLLKKDNRV